MRTANESMRLILHFANASCLVVCLSENAAGDTFNLFTFCRRYDRTGYDSIDRGRLNNRFAKRTIYGYHRSGTRCHILLAHFVRISIKGTRLPIQVGSKLGHSFAFS